MNKLLAAIDALNAGKSLAKPWTWVSEGNL
jgi:hypothetical protein